MRASEDEMAGWHKQCNGYELGQTPRDGEGQGGLACYSPWGCKESDTIRQLPSSIKICNYINIHCILRARGKSVFLYICVCVCVIVDSYRRMTEIYNQKLNIYIYLIINS